MNYYILRYTGKQKGESGERFSSDYLMNSGCPICGTMIELEGNLTTKGLKNVNNDFFETLDGDFIISIFFFKFMISHNIKLGSLNNVIDIDGTKLPLFYLKPHYYFPRADKVSGLIIENQCYFCKQNGYFNDVIIGDLEKDIPTIVMPVILEYNNIDNELLNKSDTFYTWEHMGVSNRNAEVSRERRFARPMLIVSENFKELIESSKFKNIQFERVTFVNNSRIDIQE